MSAEQTGGDPAWQPASEEELRAAYEAEIKQIRVEHVLIEQVVSLVNLGMRRTGLAPGTEDEQDIEQVRLAIEAVRALLPLIEQTAAAQAGQIREALTQLQLAFVKLGGRRTAAVPGYSRRTPPGAPSARRPRAGRRGARGAQAPARAATPPSRGRAARPSAAGGCGSRASRPGTPEQTRRSRAGALDSRPAYAGATALVGGGPFAVVDPRARPRPKPRASPEDLLVQLSDASRRRGRARVCRGRHLLWRIYVACLACAFTRERADALDLGCRSGGRVRLSEPSVHHDRRGRRDPVHRADPDPEHPRGDRLFDRRRCSRQLPATSG